MRECAWKAEDKEANRSEKRAHPTAKLPDSSSPSLLVWPHSDLRNNAQTRECTRSSTSDKSGPSGIVQRVRGSGWWMHARGLAGMHSMLPCSGQRAHQEGVWAAFYPSKGCDVWDFLHFDFHINKSMKPPYFEGSQFSGTVESLCKRKLGYQGSAYRGPVPTLALMRECRIATLSPYSGSWI